jgi:hypothetical protein
MAGRFGSMIAAGDRLCRRAGEPILSSANMKICALARSLLSTKLGEPLVIEANRAAMAR